MFSKKGQRGFTFTEMSLVLVMGGLMLGTVLKGQTMIEGFQLKRLQDDLQFISLAYISYFNRYNAIPGDDIKTHGLKGLSGGNGDGFITAGMNEANDAWKALFKSGLISGTPDSFGDYKPLLSPYGSRYELGHKNFGKRLGKRNYIYIEKLPAQVARSIDGMFDDGVYSSGLVRANRSYGDNHVGLYYIL